MWQAVTENVSDWLPEFVLNETKRDLVFFFFFNTLLEWWEGYKSCGHPFSSCFFFLFFKKRVHFSAAYIFFQIYVLESLHFSSDIILASALFQPRCLFSGTFYVKIVCVPLRARACVCVCGWMDGNGIFDVHYRHFWCEDISSLQVFLSVRFITLITAIVTHLVKCGPHFFFLSSKTVLASASSISLLVSALSGRKTNGKQKTLVNKRRHEGRGTKQICQQ